MQATCSVYSTTTYYVHAVMALGQNVVTKHSSFFRTRVLPGEEFKMSLIVSTRHVHGIVCKQLSDCRDALSGNRVGRKIRIILPGTFQRLLENVYILHVYQLNMKGAFCSTDQRKLFIIKYKLYFKSSNDPLE